ncbi:MAG TPA: hypothetical protein VHY08_10770, partial [Bacillota bacterium]|nr:hypothetical protein [Bacillota bacterium]
KAYTFRLQQLLIRYQFIYSMAGLIFGVICIFGGLLLFWGGISANTKWVMSLLGSIHSDVSDAPPGVILFLVGLFVILLTKHHYKIKP